MCLRDRGLVSERCSPTNHQILGTLVSQRPAHVERGLRSRRLGRRRPSRPTMPYLILRKPETVNGRIRLPESPQRRHE